MSTLDMEAPPAEEALTQLMSAAPEELAGCDIAEMHLLAATGLRGAEDVDVRQLIATLNQWAKRIALITVRSKDQYSRHPEAFYHSEPYWRILLLTSILQQDFQIKYAEGRKEYPNDSSYYWDCRDIFVHGLLGPGRAGTCSSLPVLLVAIGRRMGYPLHLALAPRHYYARWDDGRVQFNIEYHGQGMASHSDTHYQEWPSKWSPGLREFRQQHPDQCVFLRNFSPAEEWASALVLRGHCLEATGRWEPALEAYSAANRFAPLFQYDMAMEDVRGKIRMETELLSQIRRAPGFDEKRPAVVRIEGSRIAGGFQMGVSHKQLSEDVPAFESDAPAKDPMRQTRMAIRMAVNKTHDQFHPDAHFKPVPLSENTEGARI